MIVTIGQGIDAAGLGVATGPGGRIVADKDTLATSVPGLFAGGDAVLGPASMVDAMAQGHKAAEAIDAYLRGAKLAQAPASAPAETAKNPRPDAPRQERVKMPQADPAGRVGGFTEIDQGYSAEQAVAEAKRCLACGLCSECMQCVKACSAGAVCHDQQPTEIEIDAGSVILTPGFEEFQASLRGEFGHGRYANVLSSVQFERMLSAAGPTGGHVQRPSDGGEVKTHRLHPVRGQPRRRPRQRLLLVHLLHERHQGGHGRPGARPRPETWTSPSSAWTCAPSARSSTATSTAPATSTA